MVFFPKNKFPIKRITKEELHDFKQTQTSFLVDPFWQLRYVLLLWAQIKNLLPLCWILTGLKFFGFTTRTIFILHSLDNLEFLIEVSATYSIPLMAICKMIFLLLNPKKIRILFDTISNDFWDLGVAGTSVEISLQKRFKFINYLLLGHFTGCIFYVVMHITFAEVPIPEGRKKWLPTLISLPINQDNSPVYEILFVILTWNMFMSIFGNGFYDLLFVYGSQHLCGQFILLKELLRKLDYGLMKRYDDVAKFKSKKFQREIQKRIAICVEHHNLLLRYGNALQSLTSIIFGLQLLTTLTTLVLIGYTLSENVEQIAKSAMLLSFVFSSIIQFTIFAVQSADISQQSSSVAEAVYQCNWYLFDAKSKRNLILLIMNSQQGITLYAAGLVEMNNELIVAMGQKVFSFITLLRSLNE